MPGGNPTVPELLKNSANVALSLMHCLGLPPFKGAKDILDGVSIKSLSLTRLNVNELGEEELVDVTEPGQLEASAALSMSVCYSMGSGEVKLFLEVFVDDKHRVRIGETIIYSSVIYPSDVSDNSVSKDFLKRVEEVKSMICTLLAMSLNLVTQART